MLEFTSLITLMSLWSVVVLINMLVHSKPYLCTGELISVLIWLCVVQVLPYSRAVFVYLVVGEMEWSVVPTG